MPDRREKLRTYTLLFRSQITAALFATLAVVTTTRAQSRSPIDAAGQSRVDTPITAVMASGDPQIDRILEWLNGSHRAQAAGDRPALWLHACPVSVVGVPNTVYFEISREDDAAVPVQQGVMQLLRVRGDLRLRLHGLDSGVGDPLIGLWTRPELLPPIEATSLSVTADVPLTPTADGFAGRTACPYPVTLEGAVEATSAVELRANAIVLEDEGVDADGQRVWGYSGAAAPTFVEQPSGVERPIRAEIRSSGLTVLYLKPPEPDSIAHEANGEVVVHYSGWLTDGRRFDTSRQAGRDAFRFRLPGGAIAGWNEGLAGIARGERRRLIIPPELGFGVRGRPGMIPPNSTLIFEVECLHVDNNPAPLPEPLQDAPNSGGGSAGGRSGGVGSDGVPGQTPPTRPEPKSP